MATAALHPTHLLFKDSSAVDQCKITPGAGFASFAGPSGASVELRNVSSATLSGSAVPKSQVDALIATQEVAALASRNVIAANLTTEEAARSAGDTNVAAAAATALATSETASAAARLVLTNAIASEVTDRTAADTTNAAAAATNLANAQTANASARTIVANNLAQEIADRGAGDAAETTARNTALASAATFNANARGVINAALTAETTRATNAEIAAQAGAQTYADGLIATEQADRALAIQAAQNGVHWKEAVRVVANSALPSNTFAGGTTLTGNANGVLTVDGIALVLNDRLLVNNEAEKKSHGVYKVSTEGSASVPYVLTREPDFAADSSPVAAAFLVREGTLAADQGFIMTSDNVTVNSDDISFSVFSTPGEFSAGSGIDLNAKVISVATGGVSESMIKDNAVTSNKIAADAVGASELADDAVDTNAMLDNCVTDAKCAFVNVKGTDAVFTSSVQASSFTATSDMRAKEDVQNLDPKQSTKAVMEMRCCSYRLKSDIAVKRCGTIAQDCLKNKNLKEFVREDENGFYSVNYLDMVAMLCSSLKDAHNKIDDLMKFAEGGD